MEQRAKGSEPSEATEEMYEEDSTPEERTAREMQESEEEPDDEPDHDFVREMQDAQQAMEHPHDEKAEPSEGEEKEGLEVSSQFGGPEEEPEEEEDTAREALDTLKDQVGELEKLYENNNNVGVRHKLNDIDRTLKELRDELA